MEKTPGNITRGTAVSSCANFIAASRTTRISKRSPPAKRLLPLAKFPPRRGFSLPHGSMQISTCGLDTAKTSPHGNCCGTRARPTHVAPEELAKPIKRRPEHALQLAPAGLLKVKVDGRDTSYFEWLGAGLYSPERRGGSMHGRVFYLHELRYGFEEERFCVRIDPFPEALGELEDPEFRITIGGADEVTIVVKLERGHLREFAVEKDRVCLLNPKSVAEVAFERVLEVAIEKDQINVEGQTTLKLGVALWHGGLPVDVLPAEGFLNVDLGEETSSWPQK